LTHLAAAIQQFHVLIGDAAAFTRGEISRRRDGHQIVVVTVIGMRAGG
jgi:hypothetical protein